MADLIFCQIHSERRGEEGTWGRRSWGFLRITRLIVGWAEGVLKPPALPSFLLPLLLSPPPLSTNNAALGRTDHSQDRGPDGRLSD